MDNVPQLENSPRVSRASGMVSVQADCSLVEAVALMKDRAQVSGRTLEQTAVAVLNRGIRFG